MTLCRRPRARAVGASKRRAQTALARRCATLADIAPYPAPLCRGIGTHLGRVCGTCQNCYCHCRCPLRRGALKITADTALKLAKEATA